MAFSISDTVALVSGANRGIGKSLVEALVERGARKVYAGARKLASLGDLVGDRVVGKEVVAEFANVRREISQQFADQRTEIAQQFSDVRRDLRHNLIVTTGIVGLFATIVIAFLQYRLPGG